MTYTNAKKYLARAERRGYVANRSGIVMQEFNPSWGGNTTGRAYGINIDGDGHDGRLFGCPQIIWDTEQAEDTRPNYCLSQWPGSKPSAPQKQSRLSLILK
jgi:hypothetical protein